MNWYKKSQIKTAFPKPIKWSEDDLKAIKKYILNGYSYREIANLFNVSHKTIEDLNRRYQWVDFGAKTRNRDIFISNLYLFPPDGKGLSSSQIKKEYGISDARIKKALERLGLLDKWRDRQGAMTEDLRQRLSDNMKRQWEDPEFRNYMSELYLDPEFRDYKSQLAKDWWEKNPEAKQRMSDLNKLRYEENPQLRDQISEQMLQFWQDYFRQHPGGWDEWLSKFPEWKQQQIRSAIHNKNS